MPPVHARTDVTGFGLLGHALEMARGAQKAVTIKSSELPFLKEALAQKVSLPERRSETGKATTPASRFPTVRRNGSANSIAIPRLQADCRLHVRRSREQVCLMFVCSSFGQLRPARAFLVIGHEAIPPPKLARLRATP
jgi:hypothetical protein